MVSSNSKDSGKPFHADCFCCAQCGNSLQGKYFTTEKGMLCEEDFAVSISRTQCPQKNVQMNFWTTKLCIFLEYL